MNLLTKISNRLRICIHCIHLKNSLDPDPEAQKYKISKIFLLVKQIFEPVQNCFHEKKSKQNKKFKKKVLVNLFPTSTVPVCEILTPKDPDPQPNPMVPFSGRSYLRVRSL